MVEYEIKKQAERYRTIIDSSADGILVLESIRNEHNEIVDFNIIHCNEIGCRLGKFPENSVGKSLLQVLPHLTPNAEQYKLHKRVVETGEPVQFETTFRNEKGEEYGWFIVLLQKLEDGVLSRFIDITNKKNNEEKIESQSNLLTSILDSSINSIFALNCVRNEKGKIIDFIFIELNNKFERFLGKKKKDIIGQSYLAVIKSAIDDGMFEIKCNVVETGVPFTKEILIEEIDKQNWYDVSITRLGTDGIVQTFSDITEIKRDKERLTTVINNSQAGIFTLVPERNAGNEIIDFRFDIVNQTVGIFTGTNETVLKGSLIGERFPNYKSTGLFERFLSTYNTGIQDEIDFHFKGLRDLYLQIRVDKLGDEVLVTFTDFSQIKQIELQLQKSIEELRRSNTSLEEFTSAASHDLKEPIRKINFCVGILRERFKNEKDDFHTLNKLEIAAKRMMLLIDDLLKFSHLSYQQPAFEVVDLNDKFKKIMNDFDLLIEEKNAIINIDKLPVLKCNRRQIQQLFQNLLGNALKYSKKSVTPVITIKAKIVRGNEIESEVPEENLHAQYHLVEIADNGIGFDKRYAEKIFNVFERLHGDYEFKGSGLGLAIARRVVQNHKGYITATSLLNEGSTFKVYLPV